MRIEWIIRFPQMLPSLFFYRFIIAKEDKEKLYKDINRSWQVLCNTPITSYLVAFYKLMCCYSEFRSIFYMRVGRLSKLIRWILPGMTQCGVGATLSKNIGGGLFVQHGWSCVIDAESVGENLWINQNVTIGYRGNGHPIIGNNVRIGSGAVVLGKIRIGNNVNIGANAIVVDDVPDNCTVCSPKAVIVKRRKSAQISE